VIRGVPKNGPPPEKQLQLAGITAPRLERRPGAGGDEGSKDEPYAWASREFLRQKLLGKTVYFTVDYTVPSGREFGSVYLGNGPDAENVGHTMIAAGLVKLRVREGRQEDTPESTVLGAMQASNEAAKKGVFGDEGAPGAVRDCKWDVKDVQKLVAQNKGKRLRAVVEHVRDGCTVRAFLTESMQSVMICLTGVKTPGFKRGENGGGETAEPFAAEAKFFTETRLLQQDVEVVIEGAAGNTNVTGSIYHPRGNISEFLIKDGFARIVDWSFSNYTGNKDQLRAIEQSAKESQKRIWAGWTPAPVFEPFQGSVVEIKSVEKIVVKKDNGEKVEISLSSIRQPAKPGGRDGAAAGGAAASAVEVEEGAKPVRARPLFDIPFRFQAREFLRKQMIGKKVNINVDYIKPADKGYPEKMCGTVTIGGANMAVELIRRGFATALRHRGDDDMRASDYDSLLEAEKAAQEKGVGLHGSDVSAMRVAEVSSKAQSVSVVSALQRSTRASGIVEFVNSGSRVRMYIPKETCICNVLIAGVSVPRTGYGDRTDEPYSKEAADFVTNLLLQRDVEIEVFDADKNGNLIASVFINGQSIATMLCAEGYATMHGSAERYGNAADLGAAEASAQAAKKNMWANYDAASAAAAAAAAAASADGTSTAPAVRSKSYKPVMVTHIVDSVTFYAQYLDEAAGAKLEALSAALQGATASDDFKAKKGTVCTTKFSDGLFYRVKVLKAQTSEDPNCEVLFIDYGNAGSIAPAALFGLPEAAAAIDLAPQAVLMKLALLKAAAPDYEDEGVAIFSEGVLNKVFSASVEYQDFERTAVSLIDEESKDDIAMTMLSMGYANLNQRKERGAMKMLQDEYQVILDDAKGGRVGQWIYGDSSEDPDFGF
jgi:staphylococcal nuclease domain-containing protein 1